MQLKSQSFAKLYILTLRIFVIRAVESQDFPLHSQSVPGRFKMYVKYLFPPPGQRERKKTFQLYYNFFKGLTTPTDFLFFLIYLLFEIPHSFFTQSDPQDLRKKLHAVRMPEKF